MRAAEGPLSNKPHYEIDQPDAASRCRPQLRAQETFADSFLGLTPQASCWRLLRKLICLVLAFFSRTLETGHQRVMQWPNHELWRDTLSMVAVQVACNRPRIRRPR